VFMSPWAGHIALAFAHVTQDRAVRTECGTILFGLTDGRDRSTSSRLKSPYPELFRTCFRLVGVK
jgi:hypothetical protein